MDIIRSPLFSLLHKSFISEIKLTAYSDQKILIVTKTDEVYGLGPLPDSGFYVDNLELRPIPQLHKKKVEKFVFGENFVFILTKSGKLYVWGENGEGQLGMGNRNRVCEPTEIRSIQPAKVVDIACGMSHAIALCNDNQVYFWGKVGENDAFPYPRCSGINAIGIASSANAMFYISSNGDVYGKGYVNVRRSDGAHYSIGNGYFKNMANEWTKIKNLGNIKKIVGGKSNVVALDKDGVVFVWGDNWKKRLSHQIRTEQESPVKLSCISEKIIDIAANSQSDISAVMNENSKIYVWGGYSGGYFSKPYLTRFTSFEEVFTYLSHPSMTYKGVVFEKVKRNQFLEAGTLESIFDVPEDSDLTITVQEKDIHVHKAILKARSKYFLAMFTHQWEENNKKVLKIDGYSYDSYKSFLLYLYTGEIDITTENVFELVAIADKYSEDALLDSIGKKLDNCSIPDEIVRVLKEIMKLSSPNFVKFVDGVRKMIVASTSENLKLLSNGN